MEAGSWSSWRDDSCCSGRAHWRCRFFHVTQEKTSSYLSMRVRRAGRTRVWNTLSIITESLAFLSWRSRRFSRFVRIGTRMTAPVRLSGNIGPHWSRFSNPTRGCGVCLLLHPLRDRVLDRSSQRRKDKLALPVWLPSAPQPAVFLPAERHLLSHAPGRRKKKRLNGRRGSSPWNPILRRNGRATITTADPDATVGRCAAAADRSAEPEFELQVEEVVLGRSSLSSSPMLSYVACWSVSSKGCESRRVAGMPRAKFETTPHGIAQPAGIRSGFSASTPAVGCRDEPARGIIDVEPALRRLPPA